MRHLLRADLRHEILPAAAPTEARRSFVTRTWLRKARSLSSCERAARFRGSEMDHGHALVK
eukprot:6201668-Pleurochrysis_carterae.AAC.2